MTTCPTCNAQQEDGSRFCDQCGSPLPQSVLCPVCGQEVSKEYVFCPGCGANVRADRTEPVIQEQKGEDTLPGEPLSTPPDPERLEKAGEGKEKQRKSLPKKWLALGIGGVAVVLLIIILLVVVLHWNRKPDPSVFYIKDHELHFSWVDPVAPLAVTGNLSGGSMSEEIGQMLGGYIRMSQDGKWLFYPDRFSSGDTGYTVYRRNLKKQEEDPLKIDSEIIRYEIDPDGSKLYYLKGTDGDFYVHNMKEKDKIDSNVKTFWLSSSGNKVVYVTTDGNLYAKEGNKESVKLDSDSEVLFVSTDLNDIFYYKDGSLYRKSGSKDKVKIDGDVSRVLRIYPSGEAYYLKTEEEEIPLSDFLEDDLADLDAALQQPVAPDIPYSYEYETWEEYMAAKDAYDIAYAAYEEEYNAYRAKQARDNLRQTVREETITNTVETLYYYNGKEASAVTDAYDGLLATNATAPILVYEKKIKANAGKLKISEATSYQDVYTLAATSLSASTECCVAVKGAETVLEQNKGRNFVFSPTQSALYFLDDYSDEKGYGDLYLAAIHGTTVNKPVLYDSDVSYELDLIQLDLEGRVVYFKDVKEGKGDLYINKERVDTDVWLESIQPVFGTKTYVFFTDWNENKKYGTLKIYNGKKTSKIADDVHSFWGIDEKHVVYLLEYSASRSKGDAYLYDGSSKKTLVDNDVLTIIPIYDREILQQLT